jgi:cytochrome c oxidase accessory protein FixG
MPGGAAFDGPLRLHRVNANEPQFVQAPPGAPAPPEAEEISLLEVRKKIYVRAVHGWFARWRWALVWLTQAIYYGLPWLQWNGRQAVLLEITERKFYVFGLVLWPQDVIYLTALLVIAAYALFLFTAIAGRLWCGYACPQTVYTLVFQWIEERFEGERAARMRLDGAALTPRKAALKSGKHATWLLVAAWTGYTFVGYFSPIRDLGLRALAGQLGPWETFWIAFYSLATYGNAGYLREQVCKYMCPYARFQSAMFDRDTLIIAYDPGRGEPRGARSRKADPKATGLGDCVDCGICVQACPTGIDIRKGLQYECIGCAACIDGCDQVMERMGYPKGLIRYSSENALERRYDHRTMWRRALRTRTLVYGGLLAIIIAAVAVSLALRNPLKVDVLRDRGALAREAAPGVVENVYRVQIMNTDEAPRKFTITAEGLPGLEVAGIDLPVAVDAAGTRLVPLRLRAAADAAKPGSNAVEIVVRSVEDPKLVRREKSTFLLPR